MTLSATKAVQIGASARIDFEIAAAGKFAEVGGVQEVHGLCSFSVMAAPPNTSPARLNAY
ncbi:MAG: hypothetical protein WB660_03705 [Candidatus Sulfotelmatobacter sp.]